MKLLLIAGILLASVGSLSAAECYLCSYVPSAMGEECKDPFNSSNNSTETCEGTYCLKVVSKISGEVTSISRSCAEACSAACISLLGIEGCTYCCQGNLCNGAGTINYNLMMIIAMVTAVLKLYA
ncbi:ly6/PLAUR domain-containing protein 2-like [Acanthaster planci]|uniref:Ly6/PLAUR domain-containing protein 2-like n=1 Tax=Acanthaster planci TaxID=133434 RepID=A0A8B7Z6P7_ACAPL|nr:ly6/PLAUR domain-containing protein 2-like [Acanthaster planci]